MVNMAVDFIHITICIAIIILAVLVFLKPMQNAHCYPIIFFLASILNFTSAYARMNHLRPIRSRSATGIVAFTAGVLFLILAAVSAISIWM